jgi:hypothetical protein
LNIIVLFAIILLVEFNTPAPTEEAALSGSRFSHLRRALSHLAVVATLAYGLSATAEAKATVGDEDSSNIIFVDSPQPESNERTWVTNKPSGYYIGKVSPGDTFKVRGISASGDYVYGQVLRVSKVQPDICGWMITKAIKDPSISAAASPCDAYYDNLRDARHSFGKKFNCKPSECASGSKPVDLSPNCDRKFYYGYAPKKFSPLNLAYPNFSGLYDYAGQEQGKVSYRYTTKHSSSDGRAANVRSSKYGWGYMDRSCLMGTPKGGVKIDEDTVPGDNPNGTKKSL